jgi:hypothetical protein
MEKEKIDQVKLDFESVNNNIQVLIDLVSGIAIKYQDFTRADWNEIESQEWHDPINKECERLSTLLAEML